MLESERTVIASGADFNANIGWVKRECQALNLL